MAWWVWTSRGCKSKGGKRKEQPCLCVCLKLRSGTVGVALPALSPRYVKTVMLATRQQLDPRVLVHKCLHTPHRLRLAAERTASEWLPLWHRNFKALG